MSNMSLAERTPYPLLRQAMAEMAVKNTQSLMDLMGVPHTQKPGYIEVINGRTRPRTKSGWRSDPSGWRVAVLRLSEFFQYSPEDLFASPERMVPDN